MFWNFLKQQKKDHFLIVNDSLEVVDLINNKVDQVSAGVFPFMPIAYAGIVISGVVLAAGYSWLRGLHAGYDINHHEP